MKSTRSLLTAAALASGLLFFSASASSKIEDAMKNINTQLKAVKTALNEGKLDLATKASQSIAVEFPKIQGLEPPINREKKSEFAKMAQASASAAKTLSVAKTVDEAKAGLQNLSQTCKDCHQQFRPQE